MLKNSRFNPSTGIMDFWTEFRKPNPYRWPILGVSTFPFILILVWATSESVYIPPDRPNVTYISTYSPDRTDQEIIESNEENQRRKDELAALEEELAERKRELYKALGEASGMDVESMEAQAEVERAAEIAAEEARREAVLQNRVAPVASDGDTQ